MDQFIGEIGTVGFDFAPQGWAFCNGQVLPISQNQALFSLLGTTYGGDGITTFALPDLRGRVAVHAGQGPGLGAYTLGQTGGVENVTLQSGQLPPHVHPVACSSTMGDKATPGANLWAASTKGENVYQTGAANASMNPSSIGSGGGSQPHSNQQPSLVMNYIIALTGIFPSRN